MANSVVRNPIYLDTFSADVTISSTPITVISIVFYSAAAGDILCLEDKSGNYVSQLIQETNGRQMEWSPAKPFPFDGLQFDADDVNSGLGSGDKVWIYID